MNERPPLYIYDRFGQEEPLKLPTNGSFDAIFTDLSGDGTDDLCVVNGGTGDMTVFWGDKDGLNIENKTVSAGKPNPCKHDIPKLSDNSIFFSLLLTKQAETRLS